jgi:hypothetical protein
MPIKNAVVEQRRISARDGRPGARDVRNDKRPAGVIPRQQGHAADWVRSHDHTGREPVWLTTDLPCPR